MSLAGATLARMAVYVIAQITITDRARYERYQARFMPVLQKYEGRLLAADEHPLVAEGAWDRDLAVDRKAGSTGVVLLVKGIGPVGV